MDNGLSTVNPWLIPHPSGERKSVRLFCFPPAGAGALLFRPWLHQLPEVEVLGIQFPGREHRLKEPCFTEWLPLVHSLAQALYPHLSECPFAFFGHSLGALISFELVRELRRQGWSLPKHLFVCGRRAPEIPIADPIHGKSNSILIAALRQYGGTPEAVLQNADLMDLFLPIFRADLMVNETYKYQEEPALECPITVFGGRGDFLINEEQLEGWRHHTSGAFAVQMFPGNHMFFKDNPQILLEPIFTQLNVMRFTS